MASFNKIILVGNLTRDPEMKFTPQGKNVCKFGLAVARGFGKDQETDFFNITAWEKLAETCSQYLKKGRQVLIEGRVQIRNYETQDGQKRTSVDVVATVMVMLGSKKDSAPPDPSDDRDGYSKTQSDPPPNPIKQKQQATAKKPPADDLSDGSSYDNFDPDDMPF